MNKSTVAIVKYEKPYESVRRAVTLAGGLPPLNADSRVFIKPNIVFWTRAANFPKYGVITTSRVVEDMVVMLKEYGVREILIGDGTVLRDPKDMATQHHAFASLGYGELEKRYGVKTVNIWERPFKKVDLGEGVVVRFNTDILAADYIVNLPVLKTHTMTTVSLGTKNIKGMIDIASRKKCHNTDPKKNLHFWVARMADCMPPMFTLLDGIYTSEYGPNVDGHMHRSDILVASNDLLAADMVGAKILGYDAVDVPHLAIAAANHSRPTDLSDVTVVGQSIDEVARPHRHDFEYTADGTLPLAMAQMGISGLSYHKYDLSLCTYCADLTRTVMMAIAKAWRGTPWDDIEVLSGKVMEPSPAKKKTILFGKCIHRAHKDHPEILEMIPIKGCPPKPEDVCAALIKAGIDVDPVIFENVDRLPAKLFKRYEGRPEFSETFFTIDLSTAEA